MHRFFLPINSITSEKVNFPAPIAHQIRHVLRLKENMEVEVLDNQGTALRVRLEEVGESSVVGRIIGAQQSAK